MRLPYVARRQEQSRKTWRQDPRPCPAGQHDSHGRIHLPGVRSRVPAWRSESRCWKPMPSGCRCRRGRPTWSTRTAFCITSRTTHGCGPGFGASSGPAGSSLSAISLGRPMNAPPGPLWIDTPAASRLCCRRSSTARCCRLTRRRRCASKSFARASPGCRLTWSATATLMSGVDALRDRAAVDRLLREYVCVGWWVAHPSPRSGMGGDSMMDRERARPREAWSSRVSSS